ncbi:MAG: hypothetical protein E6G31_02890 [Actinobacteria bacterium]|nr:MAG: hypothetical protein E6G31_02890 [Actinomycetota bacterium]
MRSFTFLAGVLAATFVAAAAAADRAPRSLDPDARLDAAIQVAQQRGQAQRATVLDNFKFVGHSDLGGDIDFGDVWAHGDYAYVGSRCGDEALGGGGVRVVDISHPTHPTVASTLVNDEFTRAEDVVVRHVSTPSFTGDLAVVGIQACFGSGHEGEVPTGLRFFDVTHAAHPQLLSEWDLPAGSIGCHEVDLVQRPDGTVLAGCARNLFDQIDFNTGEQIPGAVKFVDASNPTSPQLAASWEMPVVPFGGLGCLPVEFAHSVRFEDGGNAAYVSYWDAGTVHLDLADASAPQIVSNTLIAPPDEDGDNHSMTLANGGRWLVINPEDFSPSDCGPGFGGYGEAYVYDNADTDNPTFLGTFSTPNSRSTRTDGEFTVHNTEDVLGTQFFSSWYSDGIVWWTMAPNGSSHQLGQFVPPASDRFGVPLVWGVYLDSSHDLVLASDMGSGLWIVRPKGLNHF